MYVIFDFDGTLIDSFSSAINIFNFLADEFHFNKVKKEEIPNLKHLTSMELIKYLKIPLYKIPQVLLQARKKMREEILSLEPFPQLPRLLQQLHDKQVGMGILTSNSIENVSTWLKQHGLNKYFQFIHSESNLFGKKKILKKIIKNRSLIQAKTYYIGDETRDIEAANQCNIHSIAVTWGFNSEKALLRYQPGFVANQPQEILTFLNL